MIFKITIRPKDRHDHFNHVTAKELIDHTILKTLQIDSVPGICGDSIVYDDSTHDWMIEFNIEWIMSDHEEFLFNFFKPDGPDNSFRVNMDA